MGCSVLKVKFLSMSGMNISQILRTLPSPQLFQEVVQTRIYIYDQPDQQHHE